MNKQELTTLRRLGGRLRRLERGSARQSFDDHSLSRRAIDDIGSVIPRLY